jgi:hypothetical protein
VAWQSHTWIVDNMDKEPKDRGPKDFPESLYTNSGQSRKNGRSCCLQGRTIGKRAFAIQQGYFTLVEQKSVSGALTMRVS